MLKTRTANLLDIVELVEDLPEYGVTRGEQGVVVEVFDEPDAGYILEFVDPSGTSSRLAYWVKPEQIKRVTLRKAQELEVVELAEDLPEYGVKKGERAVVTTSFREPDEAYDLEFVDESGTSSRFAYSVKPEQIVKIDIAREAYADGIALLRSGAKLEGRRKLREAVRLNPDVARFLFSSVLESFGASEDFNVLIDALRFVCKLNPSDELPRTNLVSAYLNRGIQQARIGDVEGALQLFCPAMLIAPSDEIRARVRQNLAAAHTSLATQAHTRARAETNSEAALKQLKIALNSMVRAFEIDTNERTRKNAGLAYAYLANGLLKDQAFEDAVAMFQVAEDIGPMSPALHNNYGVALALSGNLDAAIEEFEAALELDASHAAAQLNIVQVAQARSEASPPNFRMEEIRDFQFLEVPVSQAFPYQAAA
jgi:tetratricopeptide (TPR) repeat protein